jgi:hypothetical protein
MVKIPFNDENRGMIYAVAMSRHLRAINQRNISDNNSAQTLEKDILGVAGEVGLIVHRDIPLDRWNALWCINLPDVDRYEVKTSSVHRRDAHLWIQQNKIERNADQIYVLASSHSPLQGVWLLGWTRASSVAEHGTYDVKKRIYVLPNHYLAPMDELPSA